MEFETNQPADDDQRRLAEAKKITLQPLHAGITPDPIPDAEIAARRSLETSPNISIDTENTTVSQLIQPSKSALNKSTIDQPISNARSWPSKATPVIILLVIIALAWLWINAS
ncbi:hypothetical protein D3C73_16160 [compost metagenome]